MQPVSITRGCIDNKITLILASAFSSFFMSTLDALHKMFRERPNSFSPDVSLLSLVDRRQVNALGHSNSTRHSRSLAHIDNFV